MKYIIYAACIFTLSSCFKKQGSGYIYEYDNYKVYAWIPVFGADTAYKKITYRNTAHPVTRAGKIYVLGNTIYQNDILTGIHIIDNSNPVNAHRTAFIEIPGNTEMAIKGNYLYANNYNDLVVIDITHPETPTEVKRMKNMFSSTSTQKPYLWQMPPDTGYYSCQTYQPDSVVIGWMKDSVYKYTTCYKN